MQSSLSDYEITILCTNVRKTPGFLFSVYITNGKTCVFPFQYEGYDYYGCTAVKDDDGNAWCAVQPVYVKSDPTSWGYCNLTIFNDTDHTSHEGK